MLNSQYLLSGKAVASSPLPGDVSSDIKSGDQVRVDLDVELLKIMQDGHGGWNPKMQEVIGIVGTVFRVTERGDVRVKYAGLDNIWMFHPGALTKVEMRFLLADSPSVSETLTCCWV